MLATREWRLGAGWRGLRLTVETSHLIDTTSRSFYVSMKEHFYTLKACLLRRIPQCVLSS
jgi:hypothetical protein